MRINIGILVAIIVLFIMPAGVQAQSDDGLVAEWHFDEGGNVLKDSSGNGNDGVIYGATWVDGKYGKALSFDGKNDYTALDMFFNTAGAIPKLTVTAWVKIPASGGDWSVLDFDRSEYFTVAAGIPAGSINGEGDYVGFHTTDSRGTTHDMWTSSTLRDDSWHFISCVYDGTDKTIYIDGIEDARVSNAHGGKALGTGAKRYGFIGDGSEASAFNGGRNDEYFEGFIDEIHTYNRALSAEEIKALFEGVQLTISKLVSPHSIKQGQTTTITLTVKNSGTTEITDIEVSDTIPSNLLFIDGETSKTYASLKPKDSREFQYILQLNEAGTYNLDPATAMYADENGNYHTVKSKTAVIEVNPSLSTTPVQTPTNAGNNAQSASVHLHGEKTDVAMGEDILLKLAAVNLITKPTMHVQVIITPPSGMSVTSSEFVQSGAGLFTASYEIEPGVGRDIEVRMRSNQVGDFIVNGRIVYYFGDDMDNAEDHALTLPITVRAEAEQGAERTESSSESNEASTPGFAGMGAVVGLLAAVCLVKRK